MAEDLDDVIEAYHRALESFVAGDAAPVLALFSEREDVTLANPLGPAVRGRADVVAVSEVAVTNFAGGSIQFEEISRFVSPELACLHDVHRIEAQTTAGGEAARITVRVTTVFRREGDTWKVALRHADPMSTGRPLSEIAEK